VATTGTSGDGADALEKIDALLDQGKPEEVVTVLRNFVFDIRRGSLTVGGDVAFTLAVRSWNLELAEEAEFFARRARSALEEPEQIVQAHTIVLVALMQQNRLGQAIRELDFMPPEASDAARSQLHLNEGVLLYRVDRYEDALARLELAESAWSPDDPEGLGVVYVNRGAALNGLRRQAEAVEAYRRAVDLVRDDQRPAVRTNLANAYRDLGELEEALRQYELAREGAEGIEEGRLLGNMAALLVRLDRRAEAQDLLERAVVLRTAAEDPLGRAHSLGRLAELLAEAGDFRRAASLLDESIALTRAAGVPDDDRVIGLAGRVAEAIAEVDASPDVAAAFVVKRLRESRTTPEWVAITAQASREALELAAGQLAAGLESANDVPPGYVARDRVLLTFLLRSLEVGVELAAAEEDARQRGQGEVVAAILALCRHETWLAKKRFYEASHQLLETADVDKLFDWVERRADGFGLDPETVAADRALAATCRAKGVDVAFAELPQVYSGELLERLVNVGTWHETRCVVAAHADWLLSDAALRTLEEAVVATRGLARERIAAHLNLLRRCRTDGIDAAFAGVAAGALGDTKFFQAEGELADDIHPGEDLDEAEQALHMLEAVQSVEHEPQLEAATMLNAGKAFVRREKGDRIANLEQAADLFLGARRRLSPALMPTVHASACINLGHVCLELAELVPSRAEGFLRSALDAFTEVLASVATNVAPKRVRAAAEGARDAAFLLEPLAHEDERAGLRRLRLDAARAVLDAVDLLVRTGEVSDRAADVAGAQYAYEEAVELLVAERRFGGALVAVERGRGRGFLSEVGGRSSLPDFIPPELADREAAARLRIREARAAAQASEDVERLGELARAQRELDAVLEELERWSPEVAKLRSGSAPSLEELTQFVQTLSERAVVLCWYTTSDASFGFLLRGGSVEVLGTRIELSGPELVDYRNLARDDVWQRPTIADQRLSPAWGRLTQTLFPDDWRALIREAGEIVLVPHALLHELPLHALPLTWLDGRSLLDVARVRHVPSLTLAQRLAERARTGGDVVVLAHAGTLAREAVRSEFELEAEEIAALHGVPAHVGPDATAATVTALAPRASILHIAAHGYFDANDPLGSGLLLAGERPGATRTLSARDVVRTLQLPGSLVVLSGCETSRRSVQGTDECGGLVRAFLTAGASGVVASQWPVDSPSTRVLMKRFYEELERSGNVSSALCEASLELRRVETTAHPYYWAPFVAMEI
jgi:tetratricopeptide (TPR) repeat protein